MKANKFRGFSKMLTFTYWRMRLALFWAGHPSLHIQEVVIGEISESELAAFADSDFDTSDYVLVRGRE